ncbi:2TM domain-containing protein [Sinomicrobium weinanense]|uniref:2TM domain-containing protein n=1 Tax=Sinomicrobium weinanense TaxID=2842200 RepID=A0A926JVI5_9FLAO|nr:2TM domain-containing protein [Sinomicrobium weinanense]MBC9798139.1 2TM domain-containing protein [Sinomicrobium weinanense]MBU3123700.1 2TM domain-containing protein [Sinomicrobium weinanense]
MWFKSKKTKKVDEEQYELLKNAEARIRQKKRLYNHFVIFLIGSIFLIIANKILKYGEQYNWFVWAITFWAFLFVIHFFNVFVTHRFMGKEWEKVQREKLVEKQKAKIVKIEKDVEQEFLDSDLNKTE